MGNNIGRPFSSLGRSSPKPLRKLLPIENFPNATIIDCLHATLFPLGQESLALSCLNKVPSGWHVLCDLHALIDNEGKNDGDEGTVYYQKLHMEQVLANLADIDQPEEVLTNIIDSCNSSLLRPRSAKDLQTQILKYTLLATCMYRVLEIGEEALVEAESTIFTSIGFFKRELELLKIILEHWGIFVEIYNKMISTSSVCFEFLSNTTKKDNLRDAFKDFLVYNKNSEPAELESLTIKLEREPDLLPYAQFALSQSILETSPDKALNLLNLVIPQIFSCDEGVRFYHKLLKRLPTKQATEVMRYLVLIDCSGEDYSIGLLKNLSLGDDGLIEKLIRHYISTREIEEVVFFVKRCPKLIKLLTDERVDLVGVGLYELLEPILRELENQQKWHYLSEICQARCDYRSAAKFLYLSFLETKEQSDLLKCKENLKKLEAAWQYFTIGDDEKIDLKTIIHQESKHHANKKLKGNLMEPLFDTLLGHFHLEEAFLIIITCPQPEEAENYLVKFVSHLIKCFQAATQDDSLAFPWVPATLGPLYGTFDQPLSIYLILMRFIERFYAHDRKLSSIALQVCFEEMVEGSFPEEFFVKCLQLDSKVIEKYCKDTETRGFYMQLALETGIY
jgi:hypothetical protein